MGLFTFQNFSLTWVSVNAVLRGVIWPGTDAIYMMRSFTAWSLTLLLLDPDEPLKCEPLLSSFRELAKSSAILQNINRLMCFSIGLRSYYSQGVYFHRRFFVRNLPHCQILAKMFDQGFRSSFNISGLSILHNFHNLLHIGILLGFLYHVGVQFENDFNFVRFHVPAISASFRATACGWSSPSGGSRLIGIVSVCKIVI